jgi:CheY-like chemotaxis protein
MDAKLDAKGNAKRSMLIVDDEPVTGTLLQRIFTARGYSVRRAGDGFAALELIRESTPDVVISDLNMPGMSGFEFLSVLRRRLPRIYVIASSGAYPEDLAPPGIAADAFHAKGSGLAALLRLVENVPVSAPVPESPERANADAPIWIAAHEQTDYEPADHKPADHGPADHGGMGVAASGLLIGCPQCMRSFRLHVAAEIETAEVSCLYCRADITYALVPDSTTIAQRSTLLTQ